MEAVIVVEVVHGGDSGQRGSSRGREKGVNVDVF